MLFKNVSTFLIITMTLIVSFMSSVDSPKERVPAQDGEGEVPSQEVFSSRRSADAKPLSNGPAKVYLNARNGRLNLPLSKDQEVKPLNQIAADCKGLGRSQSFGCISKYLSRLEYTIDVLTGGTRSDTLGVMRMHIEGILHGDQPRSAAPLFIVDVDLPGTGKTWFGQRIAEFLGLEQERTFFQSHVTEDKTFDDLFKTDTIIQSLSKGEFVLVQWDEVQNFEVLADKYYQKINQINALIEEHAPHLRFDPSDESSSMDTLRLLENTLKSAGISITEESIPPSTTIDQEGNTVIAQKESNSIVPKWDQSDVLNYKKITQELSMLWQLLGEGSLTGGGSQSDVTRTLHGIIAHQRDLMSYEEPYKATLEGIKELEEQIRIQTEEVEPPLLAEKLALEEKSGRNIEDGARLNEIREELKAKVNLETALTKEHQNAKAYKSRVAQAISSSPEAYDIRARFNNFSAYLISRRNPLATDFYKEFYNEHLRALNDSSFKELKGTDKVSIDHLWRAFDENSDLFNQEFNSFMATRSSDVKYTKETILDTRRLIFLLTGNDKLFYDPFHDSAKNNDIQTHARLIEAFKSATDMKREAQTSFIARTFGKLFSPIINMKDGGVNIDALLDRLKLREKSIYRAPRSKEQWKNYIKGIIITNFEDFLFNLFTDNSESNEQIKDYIRANFKSIEVSDATLDDPAFIKAFVSNALLDFDDDLMNYLVDRLTDPYNVSRTATDAIVDAIRISLNQEVRDIINDAPEGLPSIQELLRNDRKITLGLISADQLENEQKAKLEGMSEAIKLSWIKDNTEYIVTSPVNVHREQATAAVIKTKEKVSKIFKSNIRLKTNFLIGLQLYLGKHAPDLIHEDIEDLHSYINSLMKTPVDNLTIQEQVNLIKVKISLFEGILESSNTTNDQRLASQYADIILSEIEYLIRTRHEYFLRMTEGKGISAEKLDKGDDYEFFQKFSTLYEDNKISRGHNVRPSYDQTAKAYFDELLGEVQNDLERNAPFVEMIHASAKKVYGNDLTSDVQIEKARIIEAMKSEASNIYYQDPHAFSTYHSGLMQEYMDDWEQLKRRQFELNRSFNDAKLKSQIWILNADLNTSENMLPFDTDHSTLLSNSNYQSPRDITSHASTLKDIKRLRIKLFTAELRPENAIFQQDAKGDLEYVTHKLLNSFYEDGVLRDIDYIGRVLKANPILEEFYNLTIAKNESISLDEAEEVLKDRLVKLNQQFSEDNKALLKIAASSVSHIKNLNTHNDTANFNLFEAIEKNISLLKAKNPQKVALKSNAILYKLNPESELFKVKRSSNCFARFGGFVNRNRLKVGLLAGAGITAGFNVPSEIPAKLGIGTKDPEEDDQSQSLWEVSEDHWNKEVQPQVNKLIDWAKSLLD